MMRSRPSSTRRGEDKTRPLSCVTGAISRSLADHPCRDQVPCGERIQDLRFTPENRHGGTAILLLGSSTSALQDGLALFRSVQWVPSRSRPCRSSLVWGRVTSGLLRYAASLQLHPRRNRAGSSTTEPWRRLGMRLLCLRETPSPVRAIESYCTRCR